MTYYVLMHEVSWGRYVYVEEFRKLTVINLKKIIFNNALNKNEVTN